MTSLIPSMVVLFAALVTWLALASAPEPLRGCEETGTTSGPPENAAGQGSSLGASPIVSQLLRVGVDAKLNGAGALTDFGYGY